MTAARVDLSVDQGEDYYAQVFWLDMTDLSIEIRGPAYMDIKDSAGQYVYRLSSPDAPVVVGIEQNLIISETGGCIEITIPNADTSVIAPGNYIYDMFVSYPVFDNTGAETGTRRKRLMAGSVQVATQITGAT